MLANRTKPMNKKRHEQIQAFQLELEQLEKDGVLSLNNEQRQRLASYHAQHVSGEVSTTSQQLGLGMRLSALFASLALSAAIYFFLQTFWHHLGLSWQLLLAIATPLTLLVAAQISYSRSDDGYFSRLFAVLSWLCFTFNLALLADLFNLSPTATSLLLWAIYAALLALLYQSKLLCSLAVLCFIAYFSYQLTPNTTVFHFTDFDPALEYTLIPSVILLGLARFTPFFAATIRGSSLSVIFLCCLILAWIPSSSLLSFSNNTIENLYHILGLALSALFIAIGIRWTWQESYKIGTFFFIIFLYSKVLSWWTEEWLPSYLFFLLIGLIAVLCLLVFKRLQTLIVPTRSDT